jgi:hypothetical protein
MTQQLASKMIGQHNNWPNNDWPTQQLTNTAVGRNNDWITQQLANTTIGQHSHWLTQ